MVKSARVMTLANNKGGVTKTTTTVNIGRGLAAKGKRVLIIDTDAQSNATWSLTQKVLKGQKNTIYEAFIHKRPLHELIRPASDSNLFIVRSSLWMNYAEVQLFNESMRERRLRNALKPYLSKFDYILIDTPPNLGVITVNAFMACTDILIPITLNGFQLAWDLNHAEHDQRLEGKCRGKRNRCAHACLWRRRVTSQGQQ